MQKPAINCEKCKNTRVIVVKTIEGGKTIEKRVPCECVRSAYMTK